MAPRTCVIEVMARHNFVLDSLVVVLKTMLSIVALEHEKIFHLELLILAPSDTESILLTRHPTAFLYFRSIEQVKHFLIVNLKKGAGNRDVLAFLGFFGLFKSIFYCSNRDAVIQVVGHLHFSSSHVWII